MCIPGLLDGLYPFITLRLLLCPQLQRFLSIMTKHDEEVVLMREKKIKREKLFSCVTLGPKHSQHYGWVMSALSSNSTGCFGCSFEKFTTANQTYGANIWKHYFLLFMLISCP